MLKVIRFFLRSTSSNRTSLFLIAAFSMSLLGGVANISLLAIVARIVSRSNDFSWTFIFGLIGL